MRAVLDTCVIFPPVLRDILLGCAARGLYQPLWSDRILEEWARAARRKGFGDAARDLAAAMDAQFPNAKVPPRPGLEGRLHLPDPADIHVLATAITGSADAIITLNAGDFPQHVLRAEGVERRAPDSVLWEMWSHDPKAVGAVLARVHARAEEMAGAEVSLRALLKRVRLPRLAKAVTG
ncbi:RSP_2648 family PIN domain-containing protein [Falsirhodobacter halotolerans]|uniref:RSP_2648 family PIN domain-containing protein n=1 Tax=Falsirhodobacter halotolerans TaxID=1146892 RepID=UPI001FD5C061|nr:PIN domain-containing protein [Falsirhodobacter halotolerans]